ncbi:MAG: hypothetical protein QXZ31_08575 [Thermofilaceae archaeon]
MEVEGEVGGRVEPVGMPLSTRARLERFAVRIALPLIEIHLALLILSSYLTLMEQVYRRWVQMLAETLPLRSPYWLEHVIIIIGGITLIALLSIGALLPVTLLVADAITKSFSTSKRSRKRMDEPGQIVVLVGTFMLVIGALTFMLGWHGNNDFLLLVGGVLGSFGFAVIIIGFYMIARTVYDLAARLLKRFETQP